MLFVLYCLPNVTFWWDAAVLACFKTIFELYSLSDKNCLIRIRAAQKNITQSLDICTNSTQSPALSPQTTFEHKTNQRQDKVIPKQKTKEKNLDIFWCEPSLSLLIFITSASPCNNCSQECFWQKEEEDQIDGERGLHSEESSTQYIKPRFQVMSCFY